MLITKQIEIDCGHRVPNHKSKCRNIHGHRYRIEVGVDDKVIQTPGSSDEGMVIDFGDLKQVMMDYLDKGFDHGFIMFENDEYVNMFENLKSQGQKIVFVDFIPTAENLAQYWYLNLKELLLAKDIQIHHVKVWETPTSTAIWTKEDEDNARKMYVEDI